MGEFVVAKRRFVVHLRTEDLHEALARAESDGHVPVETVADALVQLVEWGNLRADPDTSRVTSVEDFHRARFLYQLTHSGEAADERLVWECAFAPLEEMVGQRVESRAAGCEELASWLAQLRGSGVLKRLEPDAARARELLERLAAVLAVLPADGEPLGRFAARHAGSAHALDDGQPLATLALGAIRALCGGSLVAVQSPDTSCTRASATVSTGTCPSDSARARASWRFDAEAYSRVTNTVTSSQPLTGAPASASWDPSLSETMRRVGLRIEEESVIEELLADLQA